MPDKNSSTSTQSEETHREETIVSDVKDAAVAVGKQAAAATKGGIAISGNVGGDLVISVGSTQVAIPRFVQIVLGVIVLGVLLLVGARAFDAYNASRPTPIAPMTGDFNVAVAQFQVYGEGEEEFEEAQELALGLANAIEREIDDLADEIDDTIQIRFPQETRTIQGRTDAGRAENARALAEEINADIVIYGVVEVSGLTAVIRPEFYIGDSDFMLGAEVTGQYRMGREIQLDKIDNRTLRNDVEEILKKRFRVLTLLVNGLSDYVVGEYGDAETSFNRALEIEAWDTPDVIYVLLGNATIQQHELEKAKEYFSKALDANPDYARAYAGLATVFLQQATPDIQSGTYDFDVQLLDKAFDHYQKALNSEEQSPLADIPTKVSFGVGDVYIRKALVEEAAGNDEAKEQYYSLAGQAYQSVIQDYEAGNERLQEIAAHAHARLGLILAQNGQLEAAIAEYEQALNLLPKYGQSKEYRALYQEILDELRGTTSE